MTWFAVDDTFHGHPKLAELEAGRHFAEAIALWTIAGSWCAAHLTDGRIPSAQFRRLVPFDARKAAAELVRVGLWIEVDGGYQFRDWTHYQPTRDEVEARREGGAARTRKSRQRAKERATNAVGNDARNALPERDQRADGGVTNASDTLSRPVPSRPEESATHSPGAREVQTPKPKHVARLESSLSTLPLDEHAEIARWFSAARAEGGAGRWTWDGKSWGSGYEHLDRIRVALADEPDREGAFAAAMRGFLADERAKAHGYPIAWLANDLGAYVARGEEAPSVPARSRVEEIEAAMAACEDERRRLEPGPERDALRRRHFELQAELRAARGAA